jgi:hypothetical protein
MRTAPAILLAALAALLLLAPLPSGGKGPREIRVTAHDAGGEAWFTVEGLEGRNPDIVVTAGEEVRLVLANDGTLAHSFRIREGAGVPCCIGPGQVAYANFTAPPAPIEQRYLCQPHEGRGMGGRFIVEAAEERGAAGPAAAAVLALLGAAAAAARRR